MKPPHTKMQTHFRENAAGFKDRIPCPSQIRPQPLRTMCFHRTSAPQEKRRMILDIFHLQPAMKLTQLLSDMFVNDSRIFYSAAMFRRQTDTQIPSLSRSCCIKETALFLNTFAYTLSHFTVFASLTVIDTVNPATSPICSPSTIVTYPLETDLTSFQILSCPVSATG